MKLVSLYIFLILVVASNVGARVSFKQAEPRIYGGNFARNGQFPYFGYISYGNKKYCGASIIHQRWVLTAAHCIRPKDYPLFTFGKVDDFSNGTSIKIEEFYIHNDYEVVPEELNKGLERVENDIAVVRLDSEIEFNETVKPVELSTDTKDYYENQTATVMGWGRTLYNGQATFDLRYAKVRVLPLEECQKIWTYADIHLCTANRDFTRQQGICYGDSGSPLVIGQVQIGVVSTTDKYCQSKKPDLYTKVADFVPWIKRILKKHDDSLPDP